MTILLGFTVAGYNLDRIRSYRAKKRAPGGGQAVPARTAARHLAGDRRTGHDDHGQRHEPTHLDDRSRELSRLPRGGLLQRVPETGFESPGAKDVPLRGRRTVEPRESGGRMASGMS